MLGAKRNGNGNGGKARRVSTRAADAVAAVDPGKKLMTAAQIVAGVFLSGGSKDVCRQTVAMQFGDAVSDKQFNLLYMEILQNIRAEVEEQRVHTRSDQIQRIRNDLVQWRTRSVTSGLAQSIVAAERLLAEIEGNRAPVRVEVNVDVKVREAYMHVIAGFNAEELDDMAARQLELRRGIVPS